MTVIGPFTTVMFSYAFPANLCLIGLPGCLPSSPVALVSATYAQQLENVEEY